MIVPSLLSADFSRLEESLRAVERAGVDIVTLDVMDGHFVPNLTFGPIICSAVRKLTHLVIEAHLMITEPIRYVSEYVKAGADYVTVHMEAAEDVGATLDAVTAAGAKVGLALKPETGLDKAGPFLERIDLLLLMTVNPGFGGQAFIEEVLPKIERARGLRDENHWHWMIGVDGGINERTVPLVVASGAEFLVAGSAVFGKGSIEASIERLRRAERGSLKDREGGA